MSERIVSKPTSKQARERWDSIFTRHWCTDCEKEYPTATLALGCGCTVDSLAFPDEPRPHE